MTTSILAQKLMTIKLDKNATAKVKCLRKNILEEKHKLIGTLQDILSKQTTRHTCRLCLRPGRKKIFEAKDPIAADIKHILGIELTENDGRPQHICHSCEDIVRSAARLKQTAETTQWRLQQELEMVHEDSIDLEERMPKKHHGGYFNVKGSLIVREWTCRKCSKNFQNETEFSSHEKAPTCRPQQSKSYVCEICGRELKSLFLLKRHRLTHTDDPGQFACPQCPYRSRTKYALTVHARRHSGARPVRCGLCCRGFPSAASRWAHARSHRPPHYRCHVCDRSFRFKDLLIDHIASQHRNEKNFQCDSCGKAFATRKWLLRHERRVHNRPCLRKNYTRVLDEKEPC